MKTESSHSVAAIINFCTNESRFIRACIEQALLFCRQVIVPVSTHLFDGTQENQILLESVYRAFPQCLFIEYPFLPDQIPPSLLKTVEFAHFWPCASRRIGFEFVAPEIETILFLDADEVADGKKMQRWLDTSDYKKHTVMKLCNYWYFRDPSFRAKTWEDSIVLVKKKGFNPDFLFSTNERCFLYEVLPNPKRRTVVSEEGNPLFHHFSWVRTQEEMLKKVTAWSHRKDRDWVQAVQKEFEGPFRGTDFIHGYQYDCVEPLFQISLEPPSFMDQGAPNLIRLQEKDCLSLLKTTPLWKKFLHRFFGKIG